MNEAINTWWPILSFMALQTVVVTWWASNITQRVKGLEDDVGRTNGMAERLAGVEAELKHINATMEKLVELEERRTRR